LSGVEVYGLDEAGLIRWARMYDGLGAIAGEFLRMVAPGQCETVRIVRGEVHEVGVEDRDAHGQLVAYLNATADGWTQEELEYDDLGRLTRAHCSYDSEEFTDEERPPQPFVHEFIHGAGALVAIAGREALTDEPQVFWRRPRIDRDVEQAGAALSRELAVAVVDAVRRVGGRPTRLALMYDVGAAQTLPPTVFATTGEVDWNPAQWRELPLALPAPLVRALAEHDLVLQTLEREGDGRALLSAAAREIAERMGDCAAAGFVAYAVDIQLIDLEADLGAVGVTVTSS